jgi:hypothetical protein
MGFWRQLLGVHEHDWERTGAFSFVGRGWVERCRICRKERIG